MEIYSRQEKIKLHIPDLITVVGCGGIGSWVGFLSALIGIKKIKLIDNDRVEISNLNRTPYRYIDVGIFKVLALREIIRDVRPTTEVITINQKLTKEMIEGDNIIICCTDNNEPRGIVSKSNAKIKLFCYAENDSYKVETTFNDNTFEISGGYTVIPQWLMPNLKCAIEAIEKVVKNGI